MTIKLPAVLAFGIAAFAAAPASAGSSGFGLDEINPFQSDPTFAPQTVARAETLPGAFDTLTFQNAGLTLTGFDLVNVASPTPPIIRNVPKVPEPLSIATFASGMLALAMTRRRRG